MDRKFWVGLDMGESLASLCVLDREGRCVFEGSTEPTPEHIRKCLLDFPAAAIAGVAMESGSSPHIPTALRSAGFAVSVIAPLKASKFLSIRHHKTDTNDARGMAELARLGDLGKLSVHIRSAEAQRLRNQLVVRQRIVVLRVSTRGSLRSMLRAYGSRITRLPSGQLFNNKIDDELSDLRTRGLHEAVAQLMPLIELYQLLTKNIDQIDRDLRTTAKQHPVVSRFLEIPGVGTICALSFYSAIDDPSRFGRATDVGAYLGMIPRVKQSGTLTRRSRITRAGGALTRSHLVLAAGVLLSRAAGKSAIGDWGKELSKRIGYSKARMAVARKLAVTMLTIWKTGEDFVAYPLSG